MSLTNKEYYDNLRLKNKSYHTVKKPIIKLIENKHYQITHLNGHICQCNYAGVAHYMKCNICCNDRKQTYNFINPYNGDLNNPICQCFFGSECIKKIRIDEV